MVHRKRRFVTALVLLVVIILPLSLAGAGIAHGSEPYYYGDGSEAHRPVVSGSIIQPWLCEGWTDRQWDGHLDMLHSADINTVILQWTAETPDGAFTYAGFPIRSEWNASAGLNSDPSVVEGLLKAAEKKNVKVFVGLNTASEWWSNAFTNQDWCAKQAETGNAIAIELYGLYKAKYPHAFYGWYWPWEMYGNGAGYEKNWSAMMNITLDCLTALDSRMPALFSPFISSYIRLTPWQEQAFWTGFLSSTRLRAGDVFCPQDSVGSGELALKYSGEYLAAMRKAADTKPGLLFWVNNENFTKDFRPAGLDRFISQLYVSGKFSDTHICFSYDHYYSPSIINPSFDRAYKAFMRSGQVDKTPPARPVISAAVSPDKSSVMLNVKPADAADCHVITLYRGDRIIDSHEVLEVTTDSFVYRWEDKVKTGGKELVYWATVADCWGNVSQRAKVAVR